MVYLFSNFSKLAILYKDTDIHNLYNRFIETLKNEEVKFVSDNFMLFIKTAEAARNSIVDIQNKILK